MVNPRADREIGIPGEPQAPARMPALQTQNGDRCTSKRKCALLFQIADALEDGANDQRKGYRSIFEDFG